MDQPVRPFPRLHCERSNSSFANSAPGGSIGGSTGNDASCATVPYSYPSPKQRVRTGCRALRKPAGYYERSTAIDCQTGIP